MPKLTKRTVEAVRPDPAREVFVWDQEMPGFGLRVFPSGRRGFLVQYRVGHRTRRYALGRYPVMTPESAREMAKITLGEVARGGDPSGERRKRLEAETVADLAERYLEEHARPHNKASSVAENKRMLDAFILPAFGRDRVEHVSRADVARLHRTIGKKHPTQANRVLFLLSTLFGLAERWGVRAEGSNPCRHVPRFKERRRERYLSEAELARLGAVLAETEQAGSELPQVVAALRLLIFTGARRGEILGLRWDYVDAERRCLRLPDSKTGRKVIQLNAPALAVLASLSRETSEWVIPGKSAGAPLVGLPHAWERIRKRAKLEDVRIHDLRHAFASVGVSSGHTLAVIGGLLGHSQLSTTQRYAHLSDDPLRSASDAIGARIAAAMDGAARAEVVQLRDAAR